MSYNRTSYKYKYQPETYSKKLHYNVDITGQPNSKLTKYFLLIKDNKSRY